MTRPCSMIQMKLKGLIRYAEPKMVATFSSKKRFPEMVEGSVALFVLYMYMWTIGEL